MNDIFKYVILGWMGSSVFLTIELFIRDGITFDTVFTRIFTSGFSLGVITLIYWSYGKIIKKSRTMKEEN